MRYRLTDGHVRPGQRGELSPQFREEQLPRSTGLFEADVDFSGLDTLDVLVVIGATSAACRGDHFRLGQQNLFHAAADLVGFGEGGSREGVGLHRQAALVKVWQKRAARACQSGERRDEQRRRDGA